MMTCGHSAVMRKSAQGKENKGNKTQFLASSSFMSITISLIVLALWTSSYQKKALYVINKVKKTPWRLSRSCGTYGRSSA